ncbi:MAG: FkbM family methyltransferase [Candidatus Woesearchaeota archaeon]
MIIDKNYILKRIDFFLNELTYRKNVVSSVRTDMYSLYSLKKLYDYLPEFFKNIFVRPVIKLIAAKKMQNKRFFMNEYTKYFAVDFVLYFINSSKKLNLNSYYNDEDKIEVIKFIDNKILMALFEGVSKDFIYKKKDKYFLNKYDLFERLNFKFKRDSTKIIVNDNNYVLPVVKKSFIQSFFHSYNLDKLPKRVLKKLKGANFVDCGAFVGDSLLILNKFKFGKIYCIEPDSRNYDLLIKTIKMNNIKNAFPLKLGVGEKNKKISLSNSGTSSFINENISNTENSEIINIVSLDSYFKDADIDLIKMDIEGYEYEAIRGSMDIIRENKPVLIICLYHKGRDFVEILPLLKKLVPEYTFRFFNLNYKHPFIERVLVAYI